MFKRFRVKSQSGAKPSSEIMSNNIRSDALNLIGSYSDDCDSDSSVETESVNTPAVKGSETNKTGVVSSAGTEEPDKQQSDETSIGIPDVITQDEVPQVGMDYTIDSDLPDESTYAQIQLIESQVDGNDVIVASIDGNTNASNPLIDEQESTEKPSMKSDSTGEVLNLDQSDHITGATVEMPSDQNAKEETGEHQKTMCGDVQNTHTLKEDAEDGQSITKSLQNSANDDTNSHSTESVSTPSESQPTGQPDDQLNSNQLASDSTVFNGKNYQQFPAVSREENSQHHGYYSDEYGYDQQYGQYDQQYQYQQYYNQQQYCEEHVQQHEKEQYGSIAQHQQEYTQVQQQVETGTSTQDQQQWYMQSDHQQHGHPDHLQYSGPEQQLTSVQTDQQQYLMPDQNQYSTPPNQQEYSMSEQHQYSHSEQLQYSQPDQQQHYSQPGQQQYEHQQYSKPEQQHYSQHEQQQFEHQQYSQPDQQQYEQQQYSQPEQQQISQPDQQQYSQLDQQQYSQPDQQQYSQPEQQQFSQPDQQQYSQPDQQQQYYMQKDYTHPNQQQYSHLNQQDQQQHCANPDQQLQPYPLPADQQQQSYPLQPDHQYSQPDHQLHASSEAQHDIQPEPQGEYSHTYHEAYAQQQQYGHDHTHNQHSQSYEHQYYDASNQYDPSGSGNERQTLEHGYYHSINDRTHAQYGYPAREGHDLSFDYRQTAEHDVNQSGQRDYQPYPSHHHSDPYPRPLPHYNQREHGRRGSEHERFYPPHRDWEDHRPRHYQKWGDDHYNIKEQSCRLPSQPGYGSPASDSSSDSIQSPIKRDRAGHLSDPRLGSNVRNSPQRSYKTSDELRDPRKRQRDTKERGTENEEKHYTKSAKYAKISSTIVSRRPAMLKTGNISKVAKVKSAGPQIIEPHFVSSSPPKGKVSDKGDKSKAPVKLPEATTAKKALASFKIPKHKSSKVDSESAASKPTVKIPALDIPEESKEEHTAKGSACNAMTIHTLTKKDIAGSQDCKSTSIKPAQGKEAKTTKMLAQSTKVLQNSAPTKVLSNLDATTLQALTTIVQQTLRMAANKGMPVAKSITSEMGQMMETTSGHSGEMQNTTTPTTVTSTMTVPSTTAASSSSTGSSSTTAMTTMGQMISSTPQVLDLQNKTDVQTPISSVASTSTVQKQVASPPVSSSTPVKVASLSAPKAEQATSESISGQQQISTVKNRILGLSLPQLLQVAAEITEKGAKKPDSSASITMTNILAKAKGTHQTATSASGTKSHQKKASGGLVLATVLSGVSSQINTSKGKSSAATTAGISNPSKRDSVLVPHNVPSNLPLLSVQGIVAQNTTDTPQTLYPVDNSVVVEKAPQHTSKESNHSSEKKTDMKDDAQAECKGASTTQKSSPRLEYFNADLMFKEYNLRQNGGTASRDGPPLKRLNESVGVKNFCESSKLSKRERSLESEIPPAYKKVKLDVTNGSQENEDVSNSSTTCNELSGDSQPLQSENLTKHNVHVHDRKGRSKPSLRRKASVQRRKSQSHKRPRLSETEAVVSEDGTCEDLLCAFCHQRDGARNLGFLYGPYKFNPVSINGHQIDTSKDSTRNHPKEIWIHEDCAVWAPGVCLVGDQLIGLQEAVADGDNTVCQGCKKTGATLCCTAHGCKIAYHYPCAQETGCALKEEQFLISCSKHRGITQS